MKPFIYLLLFSTIFFLQGCGYGDDGITYSHTYQQFLKFTDTNEVIQTIYYPQINKVDTINAKVAKLRISDNIPTQVLLKSEHYTFTFTFNLKFDYTYIGGSLHKKRYEKKYSKFEVIESNAKETIVVKEYVDDSYSYSYKSTLIKDIVKVK